MKTLLKARMEKFLSFLVKASLWGAVSLVPLVFSPFTFEAFEFPKQYLLLFLVFLGILSLAAKMVLVDGEIRIKRTPLDFPVLAFLLVSALSGVVSADVFSSLFGYYGRFSDGLPAVVSFAGLYFLITNSGVKPSSLVRWFLVSSAVAVAFSYLSLFSLVPQTLLPAIMQIPGFNPATATMQGFSVFLASLLVFLSFLATARQGKPLPLAGILVFAFSSLGILLLVDEPRAWFVLLLGLLLVVGAALAQGELRQERGGLKRMWLPLALLLLSFIMLFSPLPSLRQQGILQEPLLSQGVSWSIATETLKESPKEALLGSGQGTFAIDFAKHKPADFNLSPWWQTRFDRAGSYIPELLATTGVLGLLSFLWIVGFFFLAFWFLFKGEKSMPFAVGAFAFLLGHIFYYQTSVLGLGLWLFLASGVLSFERPVPDLVFSLRKFLALALAARALFIVLLVGAGGLYLFGAKAYLADVEYVRSQVTPTADYAARIHHASRAADLNPWQAEYRIFLSRLHVGRALAELERPQAEQDEGGIARDVQRALAFSRGDTLENQKIQGALELAPSRVAVWETLGAVYRDITFAPGALEWAQHSFETALSLEPSNPVLRVELGKLYAKKENFPKAREQFEKAVALKPDFTQGRAQLALLAEREGDMGQAISQMLALSLKYPEDPETLFQLGRLYYNNGETSKAIAQFEQVIAISPNHSNAHFSLGAAYEKAGDVEKAIQEFERVLQFNPGNEAVMSKLQELQR